MLISPPFLPPRTEQQTEDEWLDLAMNGDAPGRGAFPVSFNLGWHGGIHLTAPKTGNAHEPVRAIADGTIVFVRPPTKGLPNLPAEHPLMYNGATSDGVVVIRHEAEIGEARQYRARRWAQVQRAWDQATDGERKLRQVLGISRMALSHLICDNLVETIRAQKSTENPGPAKTFDQCL